MRFRHLSPVLLASLCQSGAPRLEGHWRGVRALGAAPEAQIAANRFATQMQLDVRGNSLSIVTPRERQSGHYRVIRETSDSVVVVADDDGPSDEQTFTFGVDGSLSWALSRDRAIVFGR